MPEETTAAAAVTAPNGTPAAPAAPAVPTTAAQPGSPAAPAGKPAPRVPAAPLSNAKQLLDTQRRVKELEPEAAKYGELQKLAKSDPLKAVEALGLGWQDIAAAKAKALGTKTDPPADPAETPRDEVSARLSKLEEERAKEREDAQAREAQQKQEAISAFVADMDKGFAQQADKYPLIAEMGAGKIVWERMKKHHAETGKVPTAEEIAPQVEKELQEQTDAWIAARPRLAARIAAAHKPAATEAAPAKEAPTAAKRTPGISRAPSIPTAAAPVAPLAKPPTEEAPRRDAMPSAGQKPRKGESFEEFHARKQQERAGKNGVA